MAHRSASQLGGDVPPTSWRWHTAHHSASLLSGSTPVDRRCRLAPFEVVWCTTVAVLAQVVVEDITPIGSVAGQ